MHELSIALNIVEGALEEVERRGNLQVNAIHLRLGPLAGVDKDALLFAYPLACEGTALANSQLVIEDTQAAIFCASCNTEHNPVSIYDLHCPVCGAWECRVIRGNELEIRALEVQSPEVNV
jgi:hydrogenase nickel incorporation protein HypA/HybF